MDAYFINRPNIARLVKSLAKTNRVYAPVKSEDHRYYREVGDEGLEGTVIGEIRSVQSIKSFYFPVRTKVANYFSEKISEKEPKHVVLIGAKSCDLASLKILDYVFTKDSFNDPFYISRREEGLIISSDCSMYGETCFCVALGIMPYPTENFDINLTEIESGYVAEIGSEKGEKLIKEYFELFQNAGAYIEKKETQRKNLEENLKGHVKNKKIPTKSSIQSLFKKEFDSKLWEETAKTCVECGACNMICPACHCFVLNDQNSEDAFERLRLWDSCLLLSFARVAGGANPRKLLAERLRNRFDKKFNFFPDVVGRFGCTGCGRCIEACPGKIDIREVLGKLEG